MPRSVAAKSTILICLSVLATMVIGVLSVVAVVAVVLLSRVILLNTQRNEC